LPQDQGKYEEAEQRNRRALDTLPASAVTIFATAVKFSKDNKPENYHDHGDYADETGEKFRVGDFEINNQVA
jgi:hypothetical protein